MNAFLDSRPDSLRRLVIEPTYACNLRCEHCYVMRAAKATNRVEHLNHILPVSFWQKVLQEIPKEIIIHFTGGEIFTYPEIFELMEITARRNAFTLVTNGSILDEEDCERLTKLSPSHVTISINGNEKLHDSITGVTGSYRKTMETTYRLAGLLSKERLNVNFVLLPGNYMTLPDLIPLIKETGFKRMVIQLFDPALSRCGIALGTQHTLSSQSLDWSRVDLDELQKILEATSEWNDRNFTVHLASGMTPQEIMTYLSGKFNNDIWMCSEVFYSMRCSPTGDVYICNGKKIGELGQNKVMDIWDSAAYKAFRQGHFQKALGPECEGCCKVRRKKDGRI